MSDLKATPRQQLIGAIADAMLSAKSATGKIGDFLLGDAPELVDDLSYGVMPWKGKGFATKVNPAVVDLAGLLPFGAAVGAAGKVTKGAEGALGATSRSKQIGALRPGGAEDLYLGHGTSPRNLMSAIRNKYALTSPSLGITKGKLPTGFSEGVLLVPRLGAFDPKTYPSVIFNRDAYTPRFTDIENGTTRDRLRNRLETSPRELRGTESNYTPGREPDLTDIVERMQSSSRAQTIYDSPIFKSFAEYEKSPRGAALLSDERVGPWNTAELAEKSLDFLNPFIEKADPSTNLSQVAEALAFALRRKDMSPELAGEPVKGLLNRLPYALRDMRQYSAFDERLPRLMEKSIERMPGFDSILAEGMAKYLEGLKKFPSEYGELKVLGDVQISPEHFAGAILSPHFSDNQDLAEMLMRRPTPLPVVFDSPDSIDAFQALQDAAGPARGFRADLPRNF